MFRNVLLALQVATVVAAPAPAWEVGSYAEEVRFEADGRRAVTITIELPADAPAAVRLPLAHKNGRIKRVTPVGVAARVEDLPGAAELVVERNPAVGLVVVELEVRGKPPQVSGWGNRALAHELVNTAEPGIRSYAAEILLPEGFAVSAVEGAVPEVNGTPGGQVSLIRRDSRRGVKLAGIRLDLGARTAVRLRYRPDRRSPLVAGVLAALAGGYLIGFRSLVHPTGARRSGEGR